MARTCALCGAKKGKEVSLHGFPTVEELTAKWKRACGYLDSDCVKTLVICSNHFRPADFILYTRCSRYGESTVGVKKLKKNAVPSVNVPHIIENISPNLPQPIVIVKSEGESSLQDSLIKETILPQLACREEPSTSAASKEEAFTPTTQMNLSEHAYSRASTPKGMVGPRVSSPEVATPQRAKRALFHARYIQNNLRQKVKKLQRDKLRLKRRVSSLKQLVTLLKKNSSVIVVVP